MKKPIYKRSWFLWVVTIIFTLLISAWQRTTGPTYPVSGSTMVGDQEVNYNFLRSDEVEGETKFSEIKIEAPDGISGSYIYKRYKSYDKWTVKELKREGGQLILSIPRQPKAGKVEYQVNLTNGTEMVKIPDEPVIIRYKGVVPKLTVLLPHILLMLLAMIFSTRTGLEALVGGKHTLRLTIWTLVFLGIGGLFLGPVMQKYAFDAYWTGWPFGHDLTDNKTAVAFIFWLIALIVLFKRRQNRTWPIVAAIVLLIVYSIPHSVLGSEIDYTKMEEPPIERVE